MRAGKTLVGWAVTTFFGVGLLFPVLAAGLPENIVVNGDFSKDANGDGVPDQWRCGGASKGISISRADGQSALVIDGGSLGMEQSVKLQPEWGKVRLTMRMRATNVELGEQDWQDARLAMTFNDAEAKRVGDWPNVFHAKGSTDWVDCDRTYDVPQNAAFLTLQPANFGKSGKVEFAAIKVAVVALRDEKPVAAKPSAVPSVPLGKIGDNLVRNGDFSKDSSGQPEDWGKAKGVSAVKQDGKSRLVINAANTGVNQKIPLHPDWHKLKLTMRMKAVDVERGEQDWQDARLAMCFLGADGKRVGDWPNVFSAKGTTDWIACERTYIIPEGAAHLDVTPSNLGKSGRAEFENIRLELLEMRPTKGDVPPPAALSELWDDAKAWKQSTQTRGSVCVNGLWRFLPVVEGEASAEVPPSGECWGWGKVPGVWPRNSDWDVGEPAQEPLIAPWILAKSAGKMSKIEQAWYQRTIKIPAQWAGRKIYIDFGMIQTHAKIFIDKKPVGELWFPGGLFDIGGSVQPGREHELSILVTARALDAEADVFMAPDRVIKNKVDIKMKGLTGDVFLTSEPAAAAIADVHVLTSTRQGRITFDVGVVRAGTEKISLKAVVSKGGKAVKTFSSEPLNVDPKSGRVSFAADWKDAELWDADAPQNIYEAALTLSAADGKVCDESLPVKFGFREFWIEGRDFYLNGTKIHLRTLFTESICDNADRANQAESGKMLERMAQYGFNFFITSNYNFAPGQVSYMEGLFAAADEKGMLGSFSLPHVKDFQSKLSDPVMAARYRQLSEYLVRRVQNHPSIIMYAMNHNSTGYYGDQNPLKIDGIYKPEEAGADTHFIDNRAQAQMAADIATSIDPSRPVYHHESGNLGVMHTANTYLNWAPRQERSDWLEHWSTTGVKPLFFVEWGMPHIASWSSYRGPEFIWRCNAFQRLWDSEFAAACLGERAYEMTPEKIKMLKEEERLWGLGKPFHYPAGLVQKCESTYNDVQAWYVGDNWRAHRIWGISASLPWDQGDLWKRVKESAPIAIPRKFEDLQRPGIVPDVLTPGRQFIYEPTPGAFEPNQTGLAFRRWNMPLMACVVGAPEHFTEKSHNFVPGEKVRKQLVIVNDTRRARVCGYEWELAGSGIKDSGKVSVPAGEKVFVPVTFEMPRGAEKYCLGASFDFGQGEVQKDEMLLHALPQAGASTGGGLLDALGLSSAKNELAPQNKVALFDPKGLSSNLLDDAGVPYEKVRSVEKLEGFGILVIGREAFAVAPETRLVLPKDMKVLVFEQDYATLTTRFGFRATELGVRDVFLRTPSHPAVSGLGEEHFSNWRGVSTLTPPQVEVPAFEKHDPKWTWCGFENTRVWRCGNWGNVASVIIEKPSRGQWLPLADCGFDLQYSPLLEYREGAGRVLFCQLDVSGRGESESAARQLCRGMISYLDKAAATPARKVYYDGDPRGEKLLTELGVGFAKYDGAALSPDALLVIGPQPAKVADLNQQISQGLRVVCLGLGAEELNKILPGKIKCQEKETVSTTHKNLAGVPEFLGVSNAELHWRTLPKIAALEMEGEVAHPALALLRIGKGSVALCQAAPWLFDYEKSAYVRTSYRRNVFLVSRLLANSGAEMSGSLMPRLGTPADTTTCALKQGWRAAEDSKDIGAKEEWWRPDFNDGAWAQVAVPGHSYDALCSYWYRVKFQGPVWPAGEEKVVLSVGAVDDESWVWLNGKFLGEISKKTNPDNYWCAPRDYVIDKKLLNEKGENILAVRVNNIFKSGGIMGTPGLNVPGAWLRSYYLQKPIADDDPYRYYRW